MSCVWKAQWKPQYRYDLPCWDPVFIAKCTALYCMTPL